SRLRRNKKNQCPLLVKNIGQFPPTANKKLLRLLNRRNEEGKGFAFYNSSYGILVTRQRESHLAKGPCETANRKTEEFGDEDKNTSINCPDVRSYFCCRHNAIICPG